MPVNLSSEDFNVNRDLANQIGNLGQTLGNALSTRSNLETSKLNRDISRRELLARFQQDAKLNFSLQEAAPVGGLEIDVAASQDIQPIFNEEDRGPQVTPAQHEAFQPGLPTDTGAPAQLSEAEAAAIPAPPGILDPTDPKFSQFAIDQSAAAGLEQPSDAAVAALVEAGRPITAPTLTQESINTVKNLAASPFVGKLTVQSRLASAGISAEDIQALMRGEQPSAEGAQRLAKVGTLNILPGKDTPEFALLREKEKEGRLKLKLAAGLQKTNAKIRADSRIKNKQLGLDMAKLLTSTFENIQTRGDMRELLFNVKAPDPNVTANQFLLNLIPRIAALRPSAEGDVNTEIAEIMNRPAMLQFLAGHIEQAAVNDPTWAGSIDVANALRARAGQVVAGEFEASFSASKTKSSVGNKKVPGPDRNAVVKSVTVDTGKSTGTVDKMLRALLTRGKKGQVAADLFNAFNGGKTKITGVQMDAMLEGTSKK